MDLLYKNSDFATFVLSKVPPSYLESKAKRNAVKVFHNAVKETPGYRKFVENKGIDPDKIFNIEDFQKLPLTDKEEYIFSHDNSEISKETNPYLLYRSSGYTGEPTYWTQSVEDYEAFVKYLDFNLRQLFSVHKRKTLVISTFALSSWITGQQVLTGLSEVAKKYSSLSLFACGMEPEEGYDVLKKYSKDFDQVLFFAYPLTFKEIMDLAIEDGFDIPEANIYTVIGAEGVTYKWIQHFSSLLNKEGERKFKIVSSYGAADSGIGIASELIPCQIVKEICYSNPEILKKITGSEDFPMHFFQYNPIDNYFEVIDGELCITKDKHIPLVRYNLRDKAKLISHSDVVSTLKEYGYNLAKLSKENDYTLYSLPFMVIYGRTDGAIILNGANIYLSSFMEALQDDEIEHLLTGKFRVKRIEESDNFQNFVIQVELHKHIEQTDEIRETIRRVVVDFLVENDSGYYKAYHERYGDDNVCKIVFTNFEEEDTIKHRFK